MKKIICIVCIVIQIIILLPQTLSAYREGVNAYNLNGNAVDHFDLRVGTILDKTGNIVQIINPGTIDEKIDVPREIQSITNDNEYFIIINLMPDNTDVPFPEIKKTSVTVDIGTLPAGGYHYWLFGKDYRLFRVSDEDGKLINITKNITYTDKYEASFDIDCLGEYILFYNPAVYSVTFYADRPVHNNQGEQIQPEVYFEYNDMYCYEEVKMPSPPRKDGYVFEGWAAVRQVGSTPNAVLFPSQPVLVVFSSEYYAIWHKEEDYIPLQLRITAKEPIKKGEEDNKVIIIETNTGKFFNSDYPTIIFDPEQYDLTEWKSKWNISGSDELYIKRVEKLDMHTLELTIGGNSSDIYKNSKIYIEFDSSYHTPNPYNPRIQRDKNGTRAKMYRSDNSITITKQKKKRTSGGGVSLPSMYTVTFNTSGGSEIKTQTLSSGSLVNLPGNPEKEGYVFGGWFTDKEFTQEYNFEDKLTKNLILYAKWEEEDKTSEQIIFTVGSKTAMVFGEEKQNDVAPVIRSDRAFLPARFVAEALGAEVEWDEKTKTVTITKGDTKIVITVGADSAMINGKSTSLDASAFIENDRTYTPIRLIAEALGTEVEWHPDGMNIILNR